MAKPDDVRRDEELIIIVTTSENDGICLKVSDSAGLARKMDMSCLIPGEGYSLHAEVQVEIVLSDGAVHLQFLRASECLTTS